MVADRPGWAGFTLKKGGLEPPTFAFQFDSGSHGAQRHCRHRASAGGLGRYLSAAVAVLVAGIGI